MIAPRQDVAIEFEIASEPGILRGAFRDLRFYSAGDATAYPRKMVRRWRYVAEDIENVASSVA